MFFREFNYFFFRPTTFDQFFNYFKANCNFESVENAYRIYNDWLLFFCQRSSVYYRAQYDYHQEIVEKAFRSENQIPEDRSFSEYGLDESWEYYSSESGLLAHHEAFENQCNILEGTSELARSENKISPSYSLGESLRELEYVRNEIILHQRPTTKLINEFWFNSMINNPDDVALQLRKTPYPDYLRTQHWQRIRAAMMLIHKASCQAEGHYELFESWFFGWESEINVHHLHYRNKGNERYSDLVLLCKDHHKLWHLNATEGKSQLTILDANW